MPIPFYQVDAFTEEVFGGNPACVCLLEHWLPDARLQAIAAENNLSETSFLVSLGQPGQWSLRWFTPSAEVDLCGHATLATAHVLLNEKAASGQDGAQVRFTTKSGVLTVRRVPGLAQLEMDFPALPHEPIPAPLALKSMARDGLEACYEGMDLLCVLKSERHVREFVPQAEVIERLPTRGLILTAPADDPQLHFVSRFFAPRVGILEDPVTGSAHCMLAPYWSERLGINPLQARQISPRGGRLACELAEGRVRLRGQAVTYARGHILL